MTWSEGKMPITASGLERSTRKAASPQAGAVLRATGSLIICAEGTPFNCPAISSDRCSLVMIQVFSRLDSGSNLSTLDLVGKPLVVYFYPKDDTSGCTAEACAFRDALPNFSKLGIAVIGVSKDSIVSHEKFSKKYQLSFPLISDEDGVLCEKYGVWKKKSMYGRSYMGIERSTFLIDGKGVIRALWRKVNVPGHAEEVKKAIAEL